MLLSLKSLRNSCFLFIYLFVCFENGAGRDALLGTICCSRALQCTNMVWERERMGESMDHEDKRDVV